jgi:hypothetical protein
MVSSMMDRKWRFEFRYPNADWFTDDKEADTMNEAIDNAAHWMRVCAVNLIVVETRLIL